MWSDELWKLDGLDENNWIAWAKISLFDKTSDREAAFKFDVLIKRLEAIKNACSGLQFAAKVQYGAKTLSQKLADMLYMPSNPAIEYHGFKTILDEFNICAGIADSVIVKIKKVTKINDELVAAQRKYMP